jgi:NAD(P)H-quinone oxidoreductase subunit 5
MTLIAFFHSLGALIAIWNQPAQELLIPWLNVAGLDLTLPLKLSPVTLGATMLIAGMNLLAQIYAIGYMEMDWGYLERECVLSSSAILCFSATSF